MLSRSLKYAILFHLTAFAGLIPVWSSAQETLQRKAPARRSADHATVGDESNSADPSGSHLKQRAIWPGMTRAGTVALAQRLVAQAGRPADEAR